MIFLSIVIFKILSHEFYFYTKYYIINDYEPTLFQIKISWASINIKSHYATLQEKNR